MKNIYKILIAAGVLLAMIPVSSMADDITDMDSSLSDVENCFVMNNEAQLKVKAKQEIRSYYKEKLSTDTAPKDVKFRGIWGFAGDNESDGYFGGKLVRSQRVTILKGLYNTTGNESKNRLVGILKKGYFNGRVINPDGEIWKITGLYKIDKENSTFKMHWLTPYKSGWAKARILLPE